MGYYSPDVVSEDVAAENNYSDALSAKGTGPHKVTVSFVEDGGTAFNSTVSIQMKRPEWASTEWVTVATRTAADVVTLDFAGEMDIRAGIATGDFGAGTVHIVIAGG